MKPESTVIIDTEPVMWDDGLQERFRLIVDPDGSERLQVAVKWFKGWQNGIEWRDVPKVQA